MTDLKSFDEIFKFVTDTTFQHSVSGDDINLFQYSGFDPTEILKTLAKCNPVRGSTKKKDIQLMCYLFLARGTNITQMKERTTKAGGEKIRLLETAYGLKSKIKGQPRGSLNLARVATACPMITLTILDAIENINRPYTVSEMRLKSPGFPQILMTSIAASVIPRSHPKKMEILNAITLYNVLETRKINKDLRDSSFKDILAVAKNYIQIAFDSSLVPDDVRDTFATTQVVIEAYNANDCTEAVQVAVGVLESMITQNSFDPVVDSA